VFSIFDRVKVKIEATENFPMEISTSLIITRDDLEHYYDI